MNWEANCLLTSFGSKPTLAITEIVSIRMIGDTGAGSAQHAN